MPHEGGDTSGDDRVETTTPVPRDEQIRQRYKVVKSLAILAKEFRLSKGHIGRIIKGVNSKGKKIGGDTSKGYENEETTFEIHHYAIKVPIGEKPLAWQPNVILHKKKVDFRLKGKLNNNRVYVFPYGKASVHLTTKNVIIYAAETSPISAEHVRMRATQVALRLIPALERLLELKLEYSNRVVYLEISSQHAVMLNSKVYDILKKAGFVCVKDNKGRRILYLDASKGNKHIESDDKVRATEYVDNFAQAVKEYCQGESTPKEVSHILKETVSIQKTSSEQINAIAGQLKEVATALNGVVTLLTINLPKPNQHTTVEEGRPTYIG